MFTNTPPPRHAPQTAARCTYFCHHQDQYINQHRSIATQALRQDSPTLVTPAAGLQSVKWQAHKKLRNENAITMIQAAI